MLRVSLTFPMRAMYLYSLQLIVYYFRYPNNSTVRYCKLQRFAFWNIVADVNICGWSSPWFLGIPFNHNACFTYPSVRRHRFRPSSQEVLAIPADQLVQRGPLLLRGHLLLSFLVAQSLQEDPSLREVREHRAPLEDLEIPGGLEVPALGKFFHCIICYNCRSWSFS